jgi:hypothetical protein
MILSISRWFGYLQIVIEVVETTTMAIGGGLATLG